MEIKPNIPAPTIINPSHIGPSYDIVKMNIMTPAKMQSHDRTDTAIATLSIELDAFVLIVFISNILFVKFLFGTPCGMLRSTNLQDDETDYLLQPFANMAIRSEFCCRAISVNLLWADTSSISLAMVSSEFMCMLFALTSSPAIDIE